MSATREILTQDLLDKGITIFTKTNCSYCKKAKALLANWETDARIVYCDTMLQTNRSEFLESISSIAQTQIKTFPIIFIDKTYIGGYTELQKIYDKLFTKDLNQADFFDTSF